MGNNSKGYTRYAPNNNRKGDFKSLGNSAEYRPFYPIPEKTAELLKSPSANFSLCFPRLTQWVQRGSDIKKSETDKNNGIVGTIDELGTLANSNMPFAGNILTSYHKRQECYLKSLEEQGFKTLTIYAQSISPFVTGLGSGHPTETGMILDRNTGLPYLPASSIKGILRLAYAVNIANDREEVPDSELLSYFGSTDTKNAVRGQIVFLDAYPYKVPKIRTDIMNPHFNKYYTDDKVSLPVETESPVPITFLTVQEKSVFVFRAFFLPLQKKVEKTDKDNNTNETLKIEYNEFSEKDKIALHSAFKTAFSVIGFGGKTSIGYGRFKEITEGEAEKVEVSVDLTNKDKKESVGLEASSYIPKNGSIYKAKIIGQTKKGGWKVQLCDYPNFSGPITDSQKVQNGKIDAFVMVKVSSAKPENSIFMYSGEVSE